MRIGEIYNSLSPIRKEIYSYVRSHQEDFGEGARVRDIADHVGLVISNTHFHVSVLCDLGLLYRDGKGHTCVTGAITTVLMPDDNTEIVGADKLDKFHASRRKVR